MEKRKRGRPKKVPGVVISQKPKGKRGRPRRETPKEEVITYNSPPIDIKVQLGKTYLGMSGKLLDQTQFDNYISLIRETQLDQFKGKGFNIYKELLTKVLSNGSFDR